MASCTTCHFWQPYTPDAPGPRGPGYGECREGLGASDLVFADIVTDPDDQVAVELLSAGRVRPAMVTRQDYGATCPLFASRRPKAS